MPSVNDWAAKAAKVIVEDIVSSDNYDEERIAAVIATFAEPILKLLRECGRGAHSKGYNEEEADYPPCPKSYEYSYENPRDDACTCGADAWNARVDAALGGAE